MASLGAPLVGDRLYGRPGDQETAFYLEHTALRFTPFAEERPVTVRRRDDPDREALTPQLSVELDTLLALGGERWRETWKSR